MNKARIYILFILSLALLQGCSVFESAAKKEKKQSIKAHAYMGLHPEEFSADCDRYFKPIEADSTINEFIPGTPQVDTSDRDFDITGLVKNELQKILPYLSDSLKTKILDSISVHKVHVTIPVGNTHTTDTFKSDHNKTVINIAAVAMWQQMYRNAHDSAIGYAALYKDAKKADSTAMYKSRLNDTIKKQNIKTTIVKWGSIILAVLFILYKILKKK